MPIGYLLVVRALLTTELQHVLLLLLQLVLASASADAKERNLQSMVYLHVDMLQADSRHSSPHHVQHDEQQHHQVEHDEQEIE